jgi:negative regulator of sigma-B (phosphoserine phosphatase)
MSEPLIEWGSAGLPLPGEAESGDCCVVDLAGNRATVAVIDGLGHGAEAAAASNAAARVLKTFAHESLMVLLQRCHEELRPTRGAAMTLARFDGDTGTLFSLGAGNVKAVLLRRGAPVTRLELLVYSGLVGAQLPEIRTSKEHIGRGDVLILATDGIDKKFIDSVRCDEAPQDQAERLLADYRSLTDDALVLVARLKR